MTTKAAFLERVRELAAQNAVTLPERDSLERATAAVFQTLHRRITADEAKDVAAQLPRELERLWSGGWLGEMVAALRRPHRWNRDAFFNQVQNLGPFPASQVPGIVAAVFTALRESISSGEAEDVANQLPADLRTLWQGGATAADVLLSHEEGYAEGLVGEVPKGEWTPFLAGLSAHYHDAPVRLSVQAPDGQVARLSSRLPLLGMEPEIEPDGVRSIEVIVGETGGERPEHLVHRALHPRRVLLQVNEAGYARLLKIESEDGSRTLVHFAA